MADQRRIELNPVVTPAGTDILACRQSGDTRDKRLTATQLLSLEANDLTAAVVWANIPDANVPVGAVTQHEAALSIIESQISDLQAYLLSEVNDLSVAVTWANVPDVNITQGSVTQHQAALSISKSQFSDLATISQAEAEAGTATTDRLFTAERVKQAIDALGGGGVSDPLLFNDGTAGAPTYSFTSDPDTGVYSVSADILGFAAGGVQIAQAKEVVGANQFIVSPGGIQNNAAAPSLAFGDGDTGFYEASANQIRVATSGVDHFGFAGINFFAVATGGPKIQDIASTDIIPAFQPGGTDANTGIGWAGDDILSLIAGGKQIAQCKEVAGAEQFIVSPGFIENNAALPALAFGDGDTGFYESADDTLNVSILGSRRFAWISNSFQGVIVNSALIRNVAATATVPTIHAAANDPDTGLGSGAANQLAIIAGGVEVARGASVGGGLEQFIIAPIFQNSAVSPSLAFGDGNTGFYESADNQLSVSIAGVREFVWATGLFQGIIAGAGAILNEATTATNPTLLPSSGDADTGIGSAGADKLSLIAGALDCINIAEVGSARQIGFYVTAPISLQTGVAITSAGIHAALVALGLFTA